MSGSAAPALSDVSFLHHSANTEHELWVAVEIWMVLGPRVYADTQLPPQSRAAHCLMGTKTYLSWIVFRSWVPFDPR